MHPFGGLRLSHGHKISDALDAQVVGLDGKPVTGLFAAGEITGSVHGENRMGGNGIADALTFGRIAGRTAVLKR